MYCKKNKHKIAVFILMLAFLIMPGFAFSQETKSQAQLNEEIGQLQNEIFRKQQELEQYKEQEQKYKESIKINQAEQASLKTQVALLDNNIGKTDIKIKSTQVDMDKTQLEIKKVNLEIKQAENDIEEKKEYLGSLLRLIAQNDDKSQLEVILAYNSVSDFLDQVEYVKNLNSGVNDILDEVENLKIALEEQNEALEKKTEELKELKEKLEEQKADILDQRINKQYILDKTRQSESEYQKLLSKAKSEQQNANSAIVAAEQAIRRRLAEQQGKDALKFNDNGLVWPVPKNVITAYFHDPDYPYRHIFEHPAIDIRAGQGTAVRAAASGYVAKARDGGYGYSYIMIIHGDGLSTVYGHMSRMDVAPDEFVAQGQIIGASGGMPGTPGAGYLTTGPHMHFEVRLNGIPVNPLNYLP